MTDVRHNHQPLTKLANALARLQMVAEDVAWARREIDLAMEQLRDNGLAVNADSAGTEHTGSTLTWDPANPTPGEKEAFNAGLDRGFSEGLKSATSAGTAYTESPLFQAGERMAASLRASGCLQFTGHQVGECEARGLSANRKCGPCLVVAEWVDAVAAVAHDKASTQEPLELCGQTVAPFRANCMLTKGHQGQHAAMTRWASVDERGTTGGGQR